MSIKINKRISELVGSTTLAITARAKELRTQGADVVNFAAGEPDFDTPQSIKDAAIKAIIDGVTKYTPSIGTPQLREAVSKKFKDDNCLDYDINQIVVSCGAKHSVFNAIAVLADEGEEVIIPTPYWVSYPEMVKLSGAQAKFVETSVETNFKLTKELLESNITNKTKVLVLNSPSNPTGMIYTKEELEPIAELCVKHNIYVISDEIYEKIIYDGQDLISIASLSKEIYDLTVTINGVSKAYSMTGWRIGYAGGPTDVMASMKKFQDHSTSNPTSISQAAALQALQEPNSLTESFRDKFQARRDLITSLIDDIPELTYIKPQGAFYIFCNFSKIGESMDIAKRILDDVNVAMIPGEGFGAPGYMRLSFSTSDERIKEGISRIHSWIKNNL
ncbi:MAG: aspartate aminotransferase [Lysobacterales bacterium]